MPKRESFADAIDMKTAGESASSHGDDDAVTNDMKDRMPNGDQFENVNSNQEQTVTCLEAERDTGDAEQSAFASCSWTAAAPHDEVPTSLFRASMDNGDSHHADRECTIPGHLPRPDCNGI